MKALVCGAALIACAPAAMADEFCDDIKAVLAAGDERPAPYDSLVDPARKFRADGSLASFAPAKPVRGLPEGARCQRYIAGVADRVVGGGTHNYVECSLGKEDNGVTVLGAVHEDMIRKISPCLGPLGWKSGEIERPAVGRLMITRLPFRPAAGPADVVLEKETRSTITRSGDVDSSSTLVLRVRTPTLWVPPPKP